MEKHDYVTESPDTGTFAKTHPFCVTSGCGVTDSNLFATHNT
jgi:hypothetical protein